MVEEIKGEEEEYAIRRLIMRKNVNVIQSQVRLSLKAGPIEQVGKRFQKSFLKETPNSIALIDEGNLEFDYCK